MSVFITTNQWDKIQDSSIFWFSIEKTKENEMDKLCEEFCSGWVYKQSLDDTNIAYCFQNKEDTAAIKLAFEG